MKKLLLSVFLSVMAIGALAQSSIHGDVDGNGRTNIVDVTAFIDYLLTKDASSIDLEAADVNEDGLIDIADLTALIDILLEADNHEWVDMGLPSGTLWATCNVGASSPEEYGDYFAWGETEPKDTTYIWKTYKWCEGTINTLTKYCNDSTYGPVDNKMELDPEDDAAYVNWGKNWRMPTHQQLMELKFNCNWKWTTRNGVIGQLATGSNGNTLFFPAAGHRSVNSVVDEGTDGYLWSRDLLDDGPGFAYGLWFDSYGAGWYQNNRFRGFSVRAIRVSQD